jgi:hypothetical protein
MGVAMRPSAATGRSNELRPRVDASGDAIHDDGTIVAVGTARYGRRLAIAHYEPDGTLDAGFTDDGRRSPRSSPG